MPGDLTGLGRSVSILSTECMCAAAAHGEPDLGGGRGGRAGSWGMRGCGNDRYAGLFHDVSPLSQRDFQARARGKVLLRVVWVEARVKIVNGSRDRAELFTAGGGFGLDAAPYLVIGLIDPGAPPPCLMPDPWRRASLWIGCHDIDLNFEAEAKRFPQLHPFTLLQAQMIAQFVRGKDDDVVGLFVHCEAGVSRSAGCAAAFDQYFNKENDRWFERAHPNMIVYREMCVALGLVEGWNLRA